MKKLLALLLTFVLLVSFAACEGQEASSGNDKTISPNNASDKTADTLSSDISLDTTSTSSDTTYTISEDSAALLIGKTVGDVKAAFGNNFNFGYYSGASCMEYTDAKIIFIVITSNYEVPADSCKIRKIVSRGDTPLIDNLNCNLTYNDLLSQLGASVITEEPKYWFSDMGGDYEYTLIFNYKGYRIDFYWANEDPNTHKPQYINVMLPDDPYFRP